MAEDIWGVSLRHSKGSPRQSSDRPYWRFIPPLDASGAVQMGIDEWLLEQHRMGNSPPVLRFYTWNPSAISLGYHQKRWPDHWNHLTWHGTPIDLVRRPSGGRAVLHHGDLTYALITSGMAGRRMQVYQDLCQFLIVGWRSLGISLHYGQWGRGYIHNPNCFGTATGADLITEQGRKFIGSAQLRRGHAILQHGSMQLNPDPGLFQRVFGTSPEANARANRELCKTANLSPNMVIDALLEAARQWFSIDVHTQPLTAHEWQAIETQQHVWQVAMMTSPSDVNG